MLDVCLAYCNGHFRMLCGVCLVCVLCVCDCINLRDDTQTTHNTSGGWAGKIGGRVWGHHLHASYALGMHLTDLHEVTSVLTVLSGWVV